MVTTIIVGIIVTPIYCILTWLLTRTIYTKALAPIIPSRLMITTVSTIKATSFVVILFIAYSIIESSFITHYCGNHCCQSCIGGRACSRCCNWFFWLKYTLMIIFSPNCTITSMSKPALSTTVSFRTAPVTLPFSIQAPIPAIFTSIF